MNNKSPVYEERRNAGGGECLQESGDVPRRTQRLDSVDRSPPTDLPESQLGCSRGTRTLVLRPPRTAHIQNIEAENKVGIDISRHIFTSNSFVSYLL